MLLTEEHLDCSSHPYTLLYLRVSAGPHHSKPDLSYCVPVVSLRRLIGPSPSRQGWSTGSSLTPMTRWWVDTSQVHTHTNIILCWWCFSFYVFMHVFLCVHLFQVPRHAPSWCSPVSLRASWPPYGQPSDSQPCNLHQNIVQILNVFFYLQEFIRYWPGWKVNSRGVHLGHAPHRHGDVGPPTPPGVATRLPSTYIQVIKYPVNWQVNRLTECVLMVRIVFTVCNRRVRSDSVQSDQKSVPDEAEEEAESNIDKKLPGE